MTHRVTGVGRAVRMLAGCAIWLGMGVIGQAQAAMTATGVTWDIIGLDSNSPPTGPRHFPVGARVCSNTATAPITASLVFDSANANITLRPGSLGTLSLPALAANTCEDAYFEAEVNPTPAAYNTSRRYHVLFTEGAQSVSTPTPRELFIEHLISQNRNSITNVRYGPNALSLSPVAPGGSLDLTVGNTYVIELSGGTATQGYEQFEAFINFTNTIFQILSVNTTYSADSSPFVSNPSDKLYADSCSWEPDPNSPNYRSCRADGKVGGSNVVTLYTIKIIGGGGTSQTLNTLLYDFSGSSFHYNADYGVGARVGNIIDPTVATIAKSFSPSTVPVNGVSVLKITLGNPNAGALGGYNFVDNLPANLIIATPANVSTSGCGTPTLTATSGSSSISFSNGTVAANSNCTIQVNVTPTITGTLVNTTNNLFIGTVDTTHNATASITVNNSPPPGTGLCGLPIATWRFPTGFTVTAPAATSSSVAVAAAAGAGLTPNSQTTLTADGTAAWGSNGNITTGAVLNTANNDYFEFALNTSTLSSVFLNFDAQRRSNNGPQGVGVTWSTSATPAGGDLSLFNNATALPAQNTTVSFGAGNSIGVNSGLNPSGFTYFRIYFFNSGNTNPGADPVVDNVVFSGCATGVKPTLAKSFAPDPIAVGAVSTLTFTLTNTNAAPLTGAAFTDSLPAGLQVAAAPSASTTCAGATWAPAAASTSLTFSSGTIPASSSCTASVNVTATSAGTFTNVSGFLSTTETGTTTGSVATDTLTAILPPSIDKQFAPNPILPGGISKLTFTIVNPNPSNAISGVAFSDTFPIAPGAMRVAATPNASTSGCGAPTFAPVANAASISFSGGTIAAAGTCLVSVDVVAPTVGTYNNTSGAVSHIVNGVPINGNTASDSLTVNPTNPGVSILKQVGASATGPWTSFHAVNLPGNVFYRFTIENTGDVVLSPLSVVDPASTVNLSGCAFPSSLPAPSPLNDNHIATCVVGPVAATSGVVPNTANVNATGNGTPVSDTSTAVYATTAITLDKTASPMTYTTPGQVIAYSYLVTNTGSATIDGPLSIIDDKLGTLACPSLTTVGDLDNFFDPGESITCTGNYTIVAADITATRVTNVAHATNGTTNSPDDTVTVFLTGTQTTDLEMLKTGPTHVDPGLPITYTLLITNHGVGIANGATYSDLVPAIITGVGAACTGTTGGAVCSAPSVVGNQVSGSIPTFPVNATVTITITGTAPAGTQTLTNSATVSPPPGMTDSNPGNDVSTTVTSTPVGLQGFEVD